MQNTKVDIEIHGENETIVFKIQRPLELKATETVIPWDCLETAYLGLLQARAIARQNTRIAIAAPDAINTTRPN